jgi:hypothetical protein
MVVETLLFFKFVQPETLIAGSNFFRNLIVFQERETSCA